MRATFQFLFVLGVIDAHQGILTRDTANPDAISFPGRNNGDKPSSRLKYDDSAIIFPDELHTPTLSECISEGMMLYNGACYPLATRGPCQPGHWLVAHMDRPEVNCQPRPCADPNTVLLEDSSCQTLGAFAPCPGELYVSVDIYGRGLCGCPSMDEFSASEAKCLLQLDVRTLFSFEPASCARGFSLDHCGKCRRVSRRQSSHRRRSPPGTLPKRIRIQLLRKRFL